MRSKQIVKDYIEYPTITICDSNKLHEAQEHLSVSKSSNMPSISSIDYYALTECSKTLSCLKNKETLYRAAYMTADYKVEEDLSGNMKPVEITSGGCVSLSGVRQMSADWIVNVITVTNRTLSPWTVFFLNQPNEVCSY